MHVICFDRFTPIALLLVLFSFQAAPPYSHVYMIADNQISLDST